MSAEELYASELLRWPASIPGLGQQQQIADRALAHVAGAQVIGIGSGAVAYLVLQALGRQVAESGGAVTVVCTSFETATAAQTLGLRVAQLGSVAPDWGLDAVDEVDPDSRLLTRRGAGLGQARLLWATAGRMFLAPEPAMRVPRLGERFPLPVEVHRDAATLVARELTQLGASEVTLRLAAGKDGPAFTDSGNLLLDARFPGLRVGVGAEITAVPGVIETGLFEGYRFEML